jgi:hypothetical protein
MTDREHKAMMDSNPKEEFKVLIIDNDGKVEDHSFKLQGEISLYKFK